MKRRPLEIHRWLIAIVMLLLAPSLLFASLWIKNTLSAVYAVDRSRAGLELLKELEPWLSANALGKNVTFPDISFDPETDLGVSPKVAEKLLLEFENLSTGTTVSDAISRAREFSRNISFAVDLTSVIDPDNAELSNLISETILTVALETSAMVKASERIKERDDITVWDKMALSVQGGKFKVGADEVARATNRPFLALPARNAAELASLARTYRKANGEFQKAGSLLLANALQAETNSSINNDQITDTYPSLLKASLALWRSSIDCLIADFARIREAKLTAVSWAGTIGGVIISIALVMAVFLSRSLTLRTRREFDHLGYHDPLTKLPNRRALIKKLKELPPPEPKACTGLIHIDIRHFKAINNRYGDQAGDAMLHIVAQTILEQAEDRDFVARTGGTEFMLLRPELENAFQLQGLADRLVQVLSKERIIDGHETRLDICAGMSISKPGAIASDQLLIESSLALRSAKQKGARSAALFSPDMRAIFEKNVEIAKELREALKVGKIVPWYQPQVCARTGKIVGAEALVRWIDTADGVRFPNAFLPAASEAGYMETVDETVRHQAMAMAAQVRRCSSAPFHIGLNVSASLLMDDKCVDILTAETKRAGLQPSQVSIEILEAVMIDEFAAAPILVNVAKLSELGFFIGLDDFGTGHSSISSLRDLKVDRVKIDRSFISGVDKNPKLQRFTSALIQLARSLDISVLAEGVETEGERNWLMENDCDVIQGFLISKAIPEEEFQTMVSRQVLLNTTQANLSA